MKPLPILLLALLLPLSSCDRSSNAPAPSRVMGPPGRVPPPRPKEGSIRYLALGDSYTIGQSVEVSDRYPVQIAARLRARNIDVGDPIIIARTGWTTRNLLDACAVQKPAGPFDIVTLLIGVNNQFQGRSIDEYRSELVELLKLSIAYADDNPQHVIVLSTPDWGVTPFGSRGNTVQIAKEIDVFNAVEAEECAKLGVTLVPITTLSRTALNHSDLMAADGLHPSGKMYGLWADAALPAITNALPSPTTAPTTTSQP